MIMTPCCPTCFIVFRISKFEISYSEFENSKFIQNRFEVARAFSTEVCSRPALPLLSRCSHIFLKQTINTPIANLSQCLSQLQLHPCTALQRTLYRLRRAVGTDRGFPRPLLCRGAAERDEIRIFNFDLEEMVRLHLFFLALE